MRSLISTPIARASNFRDYSAELWRIVEAQHHVSTLKLVDTPEEQAVLEQIVEDTKPPLPPGAKGLHYLLTTPFRYAPYPNGSRFRAAGWTPGVFYASEDVDTALAELAFYRYLFFASAPQAQLPVNATEYTAFSVQCKTGRALDLTAPPLNRAKAIWMHPLDYAQCQAFAAQARSVGCEAIRYRSVRDPAQGVNVALLELSAFASKKPVKQQSWRIRIAQEGVSAVCEAPKRSLGIAMKDFPPDPRIVDKKIWQN